MLTAEELRKVREANEIINKAQNGGFENATWFDGKSINEVEFCKYFKGKHPLKYVDGSFYGMDGAVENEDIELMIVNEIEPYVSKAMAKRAAALREALKYYTKADRLPLHEDRVHFANGTYLLEGGFVPEKEFCANRLPVCYRSDAGEPTLWLAFLDQLLHEGDIPTLQEFMGYCMIPTTKAQAMLMLIGNGGEGKSRVGAVMGGIFGDNANFCPIDRLANDRFCPAEQSGKLLMIDDDMKMGALENTGILKQIITCDGRMSLEKKRRQAFQGIMYARVVGFGNGALNALYDKSDGFYRRQIVLSVRERPADRVDDRDFGSKLKAETEGITLWAIEGLKRLATNGYHFTVSEQAKKSIEESRESSENVVSFLNSEGYIGFEPQATTTSKELYEVYLEWCSENAETPYRTAELFSRHLNNHSKKYGIELKKNIAVVDGHSVRGYKGIYRKVKDSENPFRRAV
jgi:putative DNA primase/helicase